MIIDSTRIPPYIAGSTLKALCYLYVAVEATPTEIAKHIGTCTATITGLIDRVDADGLVVRVRDASDRRSYGVQLTPKGRDLVESLRPVETTATHDQPEAR